MEKFENGNSPYPGMGDFTLNSKDGPIPQSQVAGNQINILKSFIDLTDRESDYQWIVLGNGGLWNRTAGSKRKHKVFYFLLEHNKRKEFLGPNVPHLTTVLLPISPFSTTIFRAD